MPRGEQILRHWNLLRTLQTRGQGMALRDLAGEFEVTERTIQRDFEVLQELGFPIEYQEDDYGKRFWRMPPDFFRTGPLVLSLTEAVSLYLAQQLLTPLAGTLFADGFTSVIEKTRSLLPAKALDYFRELDQTVYVRSIGVTDYAPHADAIRTLTDAARRSVSVEVTYRTLWRPDQYTTRFDPYGLVYHDGDLFLIGRSHRAEAVRTFKVTRIVAVQRTDQQFERPADFSLEDNFRLSFGIFQPKGEPVEIVVRFQEPVAALIEERIWHESQRLQWLPPGATLFESQPCQPEELLATFRLSNLVEFKRWLMGFGDYAEVLRPEFLRHELRDDLLSAARQYGVKSPNT